MGLGNENLMSSGKITKEAAEIRNRIKYLILGSALYLKNRNTIIKKIKFKLANLKK